MIQRTVIRICVAVILLATLSFAGIVDDVRIALSQNNFGGAQSELEAYRTSQGTTPEYLEALSWLARASLSSNQLTVAETYAQQTQKLAAAQLSTRSLDAEPHLPLALGAAIEVQAQVLSRRGDKAKAIALLRKDLATYGNTSIAARLKKNLNLLTLTGRPAPPLRAAEQIGPRLPAAAPRKGTPTLMFFWAHWCVDCKGEGPIISRLLSEFGSKGLAVIAPTQLYGYAAQGEDAKPNDELAYIQKVWKTYYPGLQSVSVPVGKLNFNVYGASTTPTLVLIDRKGSVALYHPGAMRYEELRSAIESIL